MKNGLKMETTSLCECQLSGKVVITVVRNMRQTQKSERTRKKLYSLVTDFLYLPAATVTAQMAGRKSGKELGGG